MRAIIGTGVTLMLVMGGPAATRTLVGTEREQVRARLLKLVATHPAEAAAIWEAAAAAGLPFGDR